MGRKLGKTLPYVGHKEMYYERLKQLSNCDKIIEPFGGSFSFTIQALLDGNAQFGVFNDIDGYAYKLIKTIKDKPELFVAALMSLVKNYNTSIDDYRNRFNELYKISNSQEQKLALRWLQLKSNNGRVYAHIKNKVLIEVLRDMNNIQQDINDISRVLKRTMLLSEDYEKCLEHKEVLGSNVLWIIDPPYDKAKNGLFYTACRGKEFTDKNMPEFLNNIRLRGR